VARDFPFVGPPEGGVVFRVARNFDVFAPPDWSWAQPDGTFTNRFDDPGAYRGIPEEERFRIIYCATAPAGAFGETTAHFRKSAATLAGLEEIEDDEELDPELRGGVVPEEWRLKRHLGSTRLDDNLIFADFTDGKTLTILREELAGLLVRFELEDFDLSVISSKQRRVTQEAARFVYELAGPGSMSLAGIRYMSRHNTKWELWAIFADRVIHEPDEVLGTIRQDDPGLAEAAEVLGLVIE
jgi:hypothetical protein